MINNITINGIIYELIYNPDKHTFACDRCDLVLFCNQEVGFIDTCEDINDNNYYKTVKQ